MAEHPMNLPEELKQELWTTFHKESIVDVRKAWENSVVKAYRSGSDAQLEACCEWLGERDYVGSGVCGAYLRAAMRPKPPSLAEEAKAELQSHQKELRAHGLGFCSPAISAALERLQQLELENHD